MKGEKGGTEEGKREGREKKEVAKKKEGRREIYQDFAQQSVLLSV